MRRILPALLVLAALETGVRAGGEDQKQIADVRVYPPDVELSTARDRQSMIVQATYADGVTRDVTDEVTFRHPVFHRPEGTLLCSRNALPEDFGRIIQLIEDGRIDTEPWITHRSAFDDLPGVFPTYIPKVTPVPANRSRSRINWSSASAFIGYTRTATIPGGPFSSRTCRQRLITG